MLLRHEVTHASDLELLTATLSNRRMAERLLKQAGGSLFKLMHTMPQENGDLFCGEGSSAYRIDPLMKLQAARELAARAIIEDLPHRDALSIAQSVRDFLKHRLSGTPHTVFVAIPARRAESKRSQSRPFFAGRLRRPACSLAIS